MDLNEKFLLVLHEIFVRRDDAAAVVVVVISFCAFLQYLYM